MCIRDRSNTAALVLPNCPSAEAAAAFVPAAHIAKALPHTATEQAVGQRLRLRPGLAVVIAEAAVKDELSIPVSYTHLDVYKRQVFLQWTA